MRSSTLPGWIFLATAAVWGGCGSVAVTPGSGGSGGGSSSSASVTGSASSGSNGGSGGGASSTTGASQSSSSVSVAASSSTGPEPGQCVTNDDCIGAPKGMFCDPTTHTCEACVLDVDCLVGSICVASTCIPGCSATQACPVPETCCGGQCFDVSTDVAHCGTCDIQCPILPSAPSVCQGGFCGMGACYAGHADCDLQTQNGCEQNVLIDGPCTCTPGDVKPCYLGAPGTQGVGPCKAGTTTCNSQGTGFGACTGQVLPISEVCGNSVDDDCNGVADDILDLDGDGWTMCNGDCCELPGQGCTTPQLVNPGAYEIVNNGIDDDCDPTTLDLVSPTCAGVETLTGVTAVDFSTAMDICQTTTAAAPLAQKRWGLIDAVQIRPDGSALTPAELDDVQSYQTATLASFGSAIVPHKGPTMAALSTGRMRDPARPGYVNPGPGTSFGHLGAPPAVFLAAHGGSLPANSGCNGACPSGAGANDGVNVRLTLRAPTNAKGFSYDYMLFSGEYGLNTCSPYNDFFLTLLQSGAPGLPLDHDIAYDSLGNIASINNVHFEACTAQGCNVCPLGTSALAGTGFDVGGNGAATSWLTVDAPIVPGETFKLDFMVFDVTDDTGDTAVLLDNFRWISSTICVNCGHP